MNIENPSLSNDPLDSEKQNTRRNGFFRVPPPIPLRRRSVNASESADGPTLGWWKGVKQNRAQLYSMAAATFIFMSGGMSLAGSLGFTTHISYMTGSAQLHLQICWFISVIIGASLSTLFIETVGRRIFNLCGSVLVFIGGIVLLSASNSLGAIICTRYFNGLAVGLTIIPTIMAGSEQADKRYRGLFMTTEFIGLTIGIMLKATFISVWKSDWDFSANQMKGILDIIFGVSALLSTNFLTVDSAAFYLRQGENMEDLAYQSLMRLKSTNRKLPEVLYLYYENKDLLEDDTVRGRIKNMKHGYKSFFHLCLYRVLVSISFSLPFNWGFQLASILLIESNEWWHSFIYTILRLIGVLFTFFTLDRVGRNVITGVSMFAGSALLITVGIIFSNDDNLWDMSQMEAILILLMLYQLTSGIAAPASTVYLGEAFSISVKPLFILVIVIIENMSQIIACSTFEFTARSFSTYSTAVGIMQMIVGVLVIIFIPETKQTTLSESLKLFEENTFIVHKLMEQLN